MLAIYHEFSLIFFTVFAQLAVGMAFFAVIAYKKEDALSINLWKGSLIAMALAGLFSFTHLTNPFNAFYTLTQIGSSWMSREIVAVGAFSGLVFLACLLHYKNQYKQEVGYAALFFGVILIYVMTMVYASVKSMPMWNFLGTLTAFVGTTLLLGGGITMAMRDNAENLCLNSSSKTMLLVGLLLSLSAKILWVTILISNPAMLVPEIFMQAGYNSVLKLLCLLVGSVILVNRRFFSKNILYIAVALLVIGELFGRTLFFLAEFKAGV